MSYCDPVQKDYDNSLSVYGNLRNCEDWNADFLGICVFCEKGVNFPLEQLDHRKSVANVLPKCINVLPLFIKVI